MHYTGFSVWLIRSPFSDIWTVFDAYIKHDHKEDISGFILTYDV